LFRLLIFSFIKALSLSHIGIDFRESRHRRRRVAVREVGGPMQPLWPKFVTDTRCLIYVVNVADPDRFETAAEG
jgi:hypothetical protein